MKKITSLKTLFSMGIAVLGVMLILWLASVYQITSIQNKLSSSRVYTLPVLQQLGILSVKWSAYQRSFERAVGFKNWDRLGDSTKSKNEAIEAYLPNFKIHLQKMIKPNIEILQKLTSQQGDLELEQLTLRLRNIAAEESSRVVHIQALVKNREFAQAAKQYNRFKREQYEISSELQKKIRQYESELSDSQFNIDQDLKNAQLLMIVVLCTSFTLAALVFIRLRNSILPVFDLTEMARGVAEHGLSRRIDFPQIKRGWPEEIAGLYREFAHMAFSLTEREKTIQEKNLNLNENFKIMQNLALFNERILHGMSSALAVYDQNLTTQTVNDQFCQNFSISRNHIIGKRIDSLFEDKMKAYLFSKKSESHTYAKLEVMKSRFFDVRTAQLSNGLTLALFDDVTKLKEAEDKLEHFKKIAVAGNFSKQVAHEVRNPLNAMSLQLEILKEDLEAMRSEDVNQNIHRIDLVLEQILRLERTVKKYLDVQNVSQTNEESAKIEFNFHELVEKCIEFLSNEIQSASATVVLSLEASKTNVLGDPDAVSQVLFNLVRNSLESFHEESGERFIRICTFNDKNKKLELLRFVIEDSGEGISLENRARLFEPFFTSKASGTGLGLSLSRKICNDHGGDISFNPQDHKKSGACFEIRLPILVKSALPKELYYGTNINC